MDKDIETLRKLAYRIYSRSQEQVQQELRAIADRMEAQSKAEPEWYHHESASGVNYFFNKHEDRPHYVKTPLFTHPPADARDAALYRFLVNYLASTRTDLDDEIVSASANGNPDELDAVIAAIAAREGK